MNLAAFAPWSARTWCSTSRTGARSSCRSPRRSSSPRSSAPSSAAAATKPSRIPIALADRDASALSKAVAAIGRMPMRRSTSSEVDQAAALALAREGKVRAAVVLPPGFGEQVQNALFAGARQAGRRSPLRPFAGDRADARARAARAARDEGDRRARGIGAARRRRLVRPAVHRPRAVAVDRAPTSPTTATRTAFAGMGVQFILFMGIEVGVGVLLARRAGPVEAAARRAALALAPPRQPHRERRDHRARPARDHLRGGDRDLRRAHRRQRRRLRRRSRSRSRS